MQGLMVAGFAISRYRAGLRPLTLTRSVSSWLRRGTLRFGVLLVGATLLIVSALLRQLCTAWQAAWA